MKDFWDGDWSWEGGQNRKGRGVVGTAPRKARFMNARTAPSI